MTVRLLGSLLLLMLVLGSSFAQNATSSTAKPPAEPPINETPSPSPSQLPPVPAETSPGPKINGEVKDPDKSMRDPEEPAAVKSLWRYGDGGEYLLWYIKSSRVPPLVVGNSAGAAGLPGLPSSRVLFGDTTVDMEDRSGGRFTLALPLNSEKTIGFHGTYFFLGSRDVTFFDGGHGDPNSPTIGRPYIDATTGAEAIRTIAAPKVANGWVHVALTSRLQGVEANGVGNVCGSDHFQIDLLTGFRFFQLAEGLVVHEHEAYLAGAGDLAGTTFSGEDRISTNTRFYGGQVGTRVEFRRAGVFMNFTGKVALGDSVQVVRYSGTSITGGPTGTTVTPTGDLFSLRSNIGRYSHESFALLPELGVRVGYDLSEQARFFVGYSLLYLSEAVRPGDQIDRSVNTALVPGALPGVGSGPNRPGPLVHLTDFWVQGLTIGFEYSY
jgi:hypothetical protein